ncbi:hypothetical protein [Roseiterribacter gracilis]|uniref:Uncharacterized protein n=1 Tax=Roseiterribacter gracilis TaxID=2812848 RepID=A0A8S8X795_9PROT|nr:hypothetical protein TMPK1_16750 [Rhodospirillales bacterium TMPK1]
MPTWLAGKGNSRGAKILVGANARHPRRMLRRIWCVVPVLRDGVARVEAAHMAASFKQPLAEA